MSELNWLQGVPGSVSDSGSPLFAGTTAAITPPNGGGNNTYAWRAVDATINGVHAIRPENANFNPIPGNNGGAIHGALYRRDGSSATDHSVFLFFQLQGDTVTDNAYILGLSAETSAHLVLRKGPLSIGVPDRALGTDGVMARSTATYAQGVWVHVRLDVIVNPNGDVVLNVFTNDLDVNTVDTPTWTAVSELSGIIDDPLGIETGTPGLNTGGRMGAAYHATSSGTVGATDHIRVIRTTL